MQEKPDHQRLAKEVAWACVREKTKSSLMYRVACAMILHVFFIEHISYGMDLISIASPRMFKWKAVT